MESIQQFLTGLMNLQDGHVTFWQALVALFVAYCGGILASLTPCIYPMIPITVSVIGGMSNSQFEPFETSTQRNWKLIGLRSLAYVGGMAIVYAFLGVFAGLTGQIFGTFTNTATWYLILGIIMNAAALWMLDVFSFDPTAFIQRMSLKFTGDKPSNVPQPKTKKSQFWGAFTLGISSGFVAAPCTTPILTGILAFIAKTGSIFFGLTLMLSFAIGLGTLLLIIAFFTGVIKMLPRSGNWMNHIKIASGILLLAFAEYLIFLAGRSGGIPS